MGTCPQPSPAPSLRRTRKNGVRVTLPTELPIIDGRHMQKRITDDLEALMTVIPTELCERLRQLDRSDELLEVILDLGRVPTARYLDGEVVLSDHEVSRADLDYTITRIGNF